MAPGPLGTSWLDVPLTSRAKGRDSRCMSPEARRLATAGNPADGAFQLRRLAYRRAFSRLQRILQIRRKRFVLFAACTSLSRCDSSSCPTADARLRHALAAIRASRPLHGKRYGPLSYRPPRGGRFILAVVGWHSKNDAAARMREGADWATPSPPGDEPSRVPAELMRLRRAGRRPSPYGCNQSRPLGRLSQARRD